MHQDNLLSNEIIKLNAALNNRIHRLARLISHKRAKLLAHFKKVQQRLGRERAAREEAAQKARDADSASDEYISQ